MSDFPPIVLSDEATIQRILTNRFSFARLGDGEYRLVTGKGTKTQHYDPELQLRLRQILKDPAEGVMVGILDLYSGKEVGQPWPSRAKTTARYGSEKWARKYLSPDLIYGCASVTRMCHWSLGDHGRWWGLVEQIWAGRDVLLVTGSNKGAMAYGMLRQARSVIALGMDAKTDAWRRYRWVLEYCSGGGRTSLKDPLVLIALGATATVLAHDLGAKGIQAIDIGHLPQTWLGISPKSLSEP